MEFDLVPTLFELFSGIEGVELVAADYPQVWEEFPAIIFRTSKRTYAFDTENKPITTLWTVSIEVYGELDVSGTVSKLEDSLRDIGMVGNSRDANTLFLKRSVCQFNGVLDNESHIMYRYKT